MVKAVKKEKPDVLTIERIFNAPCELVWQAWTNSALMAKWWGPKDFTNPVCRLDLRPGDILHIDMRGPDGTTYPMKGVFGEIIPLKSIVFVSAALDQDGHQLFEVHTTATFADQGNKTKLTIRARVIKTTAEGAPYLAGMEQGWNQSLDRLAQLVKKNIKGDK